MHGEAFRTPNLIDVELSESAVQEGVESIHADRLEQTGNCRSVGPWQDFGAFAAVEAIDFSVVATARSSASSA